MALWNPKNELIPALIGAISRPPTARGETRLTESILKISMGMPVIRGEVLDKTAAFYDPGEPELRPAKPAGDRKKLLFCPDDK